MMPRRRQLAPKHGPASEWAGGCDCAHGQEVTRYGRAGTSPRSRQGGPWWPARLPAAAVMAAWRGCRWVFDTGFRADYLLLRLSAAAAARAAIRIVVTTALVQVDSQAATAIATACLPASPCVFYWTLGCRCWRGQCRTRLRQRS